MTMSVKVKYNHFSLKKKKKTWPSCHWCMICTWSSSIRSADGGSCGDEFVIGSFLGHQFFMGPLFNHSPLWHDSNDIWILDGRQAMSDDNAGPTFSGLVQGDLHCLQREGGKWCKDTFVAQPNIARILLNIMWVTLQFSGVKPKGLTGGKRWHTYLLTARHQWFQLHSQAEIFHWSKNEAH